MSYCECPICHVHHEKDTVREDGCLHCRHDALEGRVSKLEKMVKSE